MTFFGLPRVRSVDSRPSRFAVCCVDTAEPNGRSRCTEPRNASTRENADIQRFAVLSRLAWRVAGAESSTLRYFAVMFFES